jgi:hypothetical protein
MKPTRKAPKKKKAPEKQTREQIVAELVEDAMRPYLAVLPPHALQTMRDILEDALTTHPVATSAIDEMLAAPVPDQSGTRVRDENGGKGDAS